MIPRMLRQQPLTSKPRVVIAYQGSFYVERMSPLGPLVVLKHKFSEAVDLANEWAAQKEETPC